MQELRERFIGILSQPPLSLYLEALRAAEIPNGILCAGVIRNTVWRKLFPENCTLVVNDIDVPYYSAELPMEANHRFKEKLERLCPTGKWECDNQAHVHLYQPRENYYHPHAPYHSLEASMVDWWFTANTIGARPQRDGGIEIINEQHLSDLFGGILRLTDVSRTNPYQWLEARIEKIVTRCPQIQVVR